MPKDNRSLRFGLISAGLAVCVIGARCARAQNALGNGQVLDRNLRAGSGGYNTQVRDLTAQIRFNNAVVTGNAPFGKSFQGNAGYLAGDDFRGALGSDALFSFRRDSAASALAANGIRGTDALQYQFALATGQAPPPILGNLADYSGGISRGSNPFHPGVVEPLQQKVTGGTASSALRSTADFGSQQLIRPTILGYQVLQDGRTTMLTASPLLGVNAVTIGTAAGQTINPNAPGVKNNGNPDAPPLSGLENTPSYVTNPLGLANSLTSSRVDTRVEAPKLVMDSFKHALENATKRPATDTGLPTPKPDANAANQPPKTRWEQELERIRKSLAGSEDIFADPDRKPGDATDPKSEREKKEKEKEKEAADKLKPKGGLHDLISPTTGKLDPEVLRALQSTRPLIPHLAPAEAKQADTYAAHMSRGEALLRDARYFDAEDAFVRALALQPKDPLANIGRVHAQLGSTMFLSAAANLRQFFTDHPEMIGTRYAPALLPSPARTTAAVAQLRANIADPNSAMARESGMLMAYLGYQRADKALIQEGLDAMVAHTQPNQRADVLLIALLQKIWLEGKDSPETPAPPADPPAPEKPAPAPAGEQNK